MTNTVSQDSATREMLDAAAHALASPLGAITNYLYVLRGQQAGLSDLGQEAVGGIAESTEHAVGMLQSLRRWLDAETLPMTPAVLDLAEWLPAWVSGRGTCRVTGSVRVRASLAALECVIDELLRNTATHGSGVASVSATGHGEQGLARIVIEDTGPGWPTEDPYSLIKPFGASHRADGRRGLGLAMVQRLAERMDATLRLLPTAGTGPTGARVEFLLPLGP